MTLNNHVREAVRFMNEVQVTYPYLILVKTYLLLPFNYLTL